MGACKPTSRHLVCITFLSKFYISFYQTRITLHHKIQSSYKIYIQDLKPWSHFQYTYLFPVISFWSKKNNAPTLVTTNKYDLHKPSHEYAFDKNHILTPSTQPIYNLQRLKTHLQTQTHMHTDSHTHIYIPEKFKNTLKLILNSCSSFFNTSCLTYELPKN